MLSSMDVYAGVAATKLHTQSFRWSFVLGSGAWSILGMLLRVLFKLKVERVENFRHGAEASSRLLEIVKASTIAI